MLFLVVYFSFIFLGGMLISIKFPIIPVFQLLFLDCLFMCCWRGGGGGGGKNPIGPVFPCSHNSKTYLPPHPPMSGPCLIYFFLQKDWWHTKNLGDIIAYIILTVSLNPNSLFQLKRSLFDPLRSLEIEGSYMYLSLCAHVCTSFFVG